MVPCTERQPLISGVRTLCNGPPVPPVAQSRHTAIFGIQAPREPVQSAIEVGQFCPWARRPRQGVSHVTLQALPEVTPNPSFKRRATGVALGPRGSVVHHPPRGPSATPVSPA